jgi:hypothetical protein
LFAELLAEGAREAADIAKNALDPNKSQSVEDQTQSIETRTRSASGRAPNPRENKPPRLSIDGRALNERTGRYAEGEIAGRGGTLGI